MNFQFIMQKLRELTDKLTFKHLPLLFLVVVTLWLRVANLGYSDYQGDEIKALFLPDPGQTATQFLMEQRMST